MRQHWIVWSLPCNATMAMQPSWLKRKAHSEDCCILAILVPSVICGQNKANHLLPTGWSNKPTSCSSIKHTIHKKSLWTVRWVMRLHLPGFALGLSGTSFTIRSLGTGLCATAATWMANWLRVWNGMSKNLRRWQGFEFIRLETTC